MTVKHKIWLLVPAVFILTLLMSFTVTALLLRPRKLEIRNINLDTVNDGDYIGICQNKILFAVVRVHVTDHKITSIDILEHKASYMKQANQIAADVCSGQSLEIDAITGATLTSDTVLKAIENALSGNR